MKKLTLLLVLISGLASAQVAQWNAINGGNIPNNVWSMYQSGTTLYIGTENASASNRLFTYNGTAPSVVSNYNTAVNTSFGSRIVAIGPNQWNKVGVYDANSANSIVYFNAYDGAAYSNNHSFTTSGWSTSPNSLITSGFVALPMIGNAGSYVGGFISVAYTHSGNSVTNMGNSQVANGYTPDMVWKGDTVYALGRSNVPLMYMLPNGNWVYAINSYTTFTQFSLVRLSTIEYYQGNFYIGAYCDLSNPHYKILRWDGSDVTDVTPTGFGTINMIHDMQVYGGKLYVGGDKLLSFNGTAWSSDATLTGGHINCIGTYNGDLYIGGSFTQVSGVPNTGKIARMSLINAPVSSFIPSSSSVCQGGSVSFNNTSTATNATYSWSFPGGIPATSTQQNPPSVTYSTPGSYTVQLTVTNVAGTSTSTSTITVNANPTPTVTPSGPTTFCQGGSVVLDAGSYSTYAWSNAATSQTVSVSVSGSYSVTVTNVNGCVGTSSPISVTVNSNPTPAITGNLAFCQGDSTLLSTSQSYASYSWSTLESTQNIYANSGGSYSVTVTDANGCLGTASVTVTANPLPAVPTITTSGPSLVSSSASGNQWYLNSNIIGGATSQSYTPTANGAYIVTVTDGNGCSSSSAPYTVTTVGMDELTAGTTTPYTISNGIIQVNLNGSWSMYDINGRIVATGSGVSTLDASGVFFLVSKNASYKLINLK